MKRYKNLYKEIISKENLKLAHKRARRGKSNYFEVIRINNNEDKYITKLNNILKSKSFKNSEYTSFIKKGKKDREIFRLPYYPDRVIHHAIMNVLEPIWKNIFIRDTYSSIRGRGIHDGVKRIKEFLKDKENTTYCLKLDIKKFYPSIDNNILKKLIRKKIKCKDTLELLDEIINSHDGVPIGNYLSQYFGNLYLTYFDHWIKEDLKIKYYCRYCDDIIILHNNKEYLHKIFNKLENYLHTNLKLKIKDNWQIFPVEKRGIDFLGYVFYYTHVKLRKDIKKNFIRNTNSIRKNWINKNDTEIINSVMSYWGWFRYGDCKNLWFTYIDKEIYNIFWTITKAKER